MRTLLLLRHAKADRSEGKGDDRGRPLSDEGRADAEAVARFLAARGYAAARVLCSSSLRTAETLARIRASLCSGAKESLDDALYLAGAGQLLESIAALDDAEPSALLIGHNPGIHQLARSLATEGDPNALSKMARGFPPASCAVIRLAGERWAEASLGGLLVEFVSPEDVVG